MRDGHTFKTFQPYGAGYVLDSISYPTFPPFSEAELNSKDETNLGQVIVDGYGNIYMKVRYMQTTTAGSKGLLVCWAGLFNSVTAGQEPVTGSYTSSTGVLSLTDSTTAYTANQLKGALLMVCGSAANAYGLVREIYSNTATASNAVAVKLSRSVENNIKAKVDGVGQLDANQLTATASKVNTVPTTSTKAILARPIYEVILASASNVTTKMPVGVLLGSVTARSGSDVYCTWIQVRGLGLVKFKKNDGAGNYDTAYGSAIFVGATAGCGTAGQSTALNDVNLPNITGTWLVATATDGVLVPAVINPFLRLY